MTSHGYRAEPGELRAVAGAVSAEALQALVLQQRLQDLRPPDLGWVGRRMRENSGELSERLAGALEVTLKRLQSLGMRMERTAAQIEESDRRSARDTRSTGAL